MKFIGLAILVASCTQTKPPPKSFEQVDKKTYCNEYVMANSKRELQLIHKVVPMLPQQAIDSKQEGWVLVSYTVNSDGSVTNPVVVDSSPDKLFDESARIAITSFRYKPLSAGLTSLTACNRFFFSFPE
jgi:TonB family protein